MQRKKKQNKTKTQEKKMLQKSFRMALKDRQTLWLLCYKQKLRHGTAPQSVMGCTKTLWQRWPQLHRGKSPNFFSCYGLQPFSLRPEMDDESPGPVLASCISLLALCSLDTIPLPHFQTGMLSKGSFFLLPGTAEQTITPGRRQDQEKCHSKQFSQERQEDLINKTWILPFSSSQWLLGTWI